MLSKTFVHRPVGHLARSRTGFQASGFSFTAQSSEDTAACLVMSESIYAMRLTHTKIGEFTPQDIAVAHPSTEVLIALSADSRQEVRDLVDKAIDRVAGNSGRHRTMDSWPDAPSKTSMGLSGKSSGWILPAFRARRA